MKKKLLLVFVVVIFALSSMGMGFAGEQHTEFLPYTFTRDNEVGKDVGYVYAFVNQANKLNITITDAYPGYRAFVHFKIQNILEEPTMYLKSITRSYPPEIELVVTDLNEVPFPYNTPLAPGQILDGMVNITILSGAAEDASYSFGVDIHFSADPS